MDPSDRTVVLLFADPPAADRATIELNAFFAAYAIEADSDSSGEFRLETSPAAGALMSRHGFEWAGELSWGYVQRRGCEPEVRALGRHLMVYHSVCKQLAEALGQYAAGVGARVVVDESGYLPLFILTLGVPATGPGRAAADELWSYTLEFSEPMANVPRLWRCIVGGDPFPGFNDGKTIGLAMMLRPSGLDDILEDLGRRGLDDVRIRADATGGLTNFQRVAKATCVECGNEQVVFLDKEKHQLPDDQVGCSECDGMFSVGDLTLAADS